MPQAAVGGTAYIKVDGQQYALKGSLKITGDKVREGVAGQDGVHGYLERHQVPAIEATFTDMDGLRKDDLEAIVDSSITVELINGKAYVLRNAWFAGLFELETEEGEVAVKFEGMKLEEIKA
ncbi:phage tail tube protein [Vampirovibrio chlorellavorus]|uniref:phage tail tube protein n=1 Tax=Vampirovibrio chlorellavorus TaxID=758823 RepID=UPI0026EF1DDF|nr:phage tail tube protein [Vampirovibrio chlorellavorus]